MRVLLLAAGAYLGGAVPMGLLVGRWARGVDIRRHGSGNIGATNVLRTIGAAWAVPVLLFDLGKGLAPVAVGGALGFSPAALALVALCAVAGHNWSVFLGFRGGKGVATSLGVLLGLAPGAAVGVAFVWVFTVLVTGYASVASLLGLAAAGPLLQLLAAPPPFVALGAVLFGLAVWQHRDNLKRLFQGRELPILGRRPEMSAQRDGSSSDGDR